MNRRRFLGIAGGGTLLAASGGGIALATRTPDTALQPWSVAGSLYDEPRRRALSWAVLAPNPHNRQPWLVDLDTPGEVHLYGDTDRVLPETDPFSRQITIGLGCFLELMVLAAAEDGQRVELALFPDGVDPERLDGRPVAVARFVPDAAVRPDPLFAHVLERRSLKEPFDTTRPVAADTLRRVLAAAVHGPRTDGSVERASTETLRALTRDALVLEIDTPRTYLESVELFRIGKTEVEANPDGIDFTGPLFETLHLLGQFDREQVLDRESTAFAAGYEAVLANADTAMGHLWQVSADNSRESQIAAGRDWLRINLASTAEGLGLQPLSQALQEYPEMQTLYDRTHELLAPEGGTVQMLARVGYGESVAPSPRWPLSAKIIDGDA